MKLGIAFEGGASRTYFSCGVMKTFIEHNIKADVIAGSSAGIANAISYASWQADRFETVLKDYYCTPQYMGVKYMFKKDVRSMYNIPLVFDKIPNELVPFDYEAFDRMGIKSVATVTNIETAKTEYITLDGSDKEWKVLVATCALPILFPPVEIDGKTYMDGGITDSVPVDYLIEKESCDKVIVVLTQEREYRKEKDDWTLKLSANKFKDYPEFANALLNRNNNYNETREHLYELEKEGKIFIIMPEVMQGISRTENNYDKLIGIFNHGVYCCNKQLDNLKNYLNK